LLLSGPTHCLIQCVCPKQIREFLEKNYEETSGKQTVKLAIRALMETVEASSKSIEVAVMTLDGGLKFLDDAEVDELAKEVEVEKAALEAQKRGQTNTAA
jgi:20S proteasome subunit alpha 4